MDDRIDLPDDGLLYRLPSRISFLMNQILAFPVDVLLDLPCDFLSYQVIQGMVFIQDVVRSKRILPCSTLFFARNCAFFEFKYLVEPSDSNFSEKPVGKRLGAELEQRTIAWNFILVKNQYTSPDFGGMITRLPALLKALGSLENITCEMERKALPRSFIFVLNIAVNDRYLLKFLGRRKSRSDQDMVEGLVSVCKPDHPSLSKLPKFPR